MLLQLLLLALLLILTHFVSMILTLLLSIFILPILISILIILLCYLWLISFLVIFLLARLLPPLLLQLLPQVLLLLSSQSFLIYLHFFLDLTLISYLRVLLFHFNCPPSFWVLLSYLNFFHQILRQYQSPCNFGIYSLYSFGIPVHLGSCELARLSYFLDFSVS